MDDPLICHSSSTECWAQMSRNFHCDVQLKTTCMFIFFTQEFYFAESVKIVVHMATRASCLHFFFLFLSLSHVLSLVCDRKCHHHSATILCPRCCCSSLRDNNSPYTPFGYSVLGSGPTMPFSLFLCYSVSWL